MSMHNGLQYAPIFILLIGILLNRYDVNALRRDLDGQIDKLDKKLDRNRDEFLRRTDAIIGMQFGYTERIKAMEVKHQDNER